MVFSASRKESVATQTMAPGLTETYTLPNSGRIIDGDAAYETD